ncbi:MAG: thioredoxin fold domain-containing protein [Desulfonauticus sp.]|nr:thioredoxin fold domain-containing protein [Desulfonauticus sp.]
MKRIVFITLIFWGFSLGIGFSLDCNNINKQDIIRHLPKNAFTKSFFSKAKIASKRKIKDMCEVILELSNRFYTCYLTKDFLIIGQMYSNGKSISKPVIEKLKLKQTKETEKEFFNQRKNLDKFAAIVYKPSPTAQKVLYMFTDPLCPFCHKAETKIKQIVDKYNVILKIILYPVHPIIGPKKAIEAICRNFDLKQYLSQQWKKEKENDIEKYQCNKGKKILETSKEIGDKLNIRGVPTFLLDNGTKIIGANLIQLESALKELTKHQSK